MDNLFNIRIVCVLDITDKYYGGHGIKSGNRYNAYISPDKEHYIIAFSNYSCGFPIKHFRTIEEIREEKLNRII